MNSKKIVIVGSAHPLRGGIAAFNERMAAEFLSQGHQVEILSFSFQYPGFLFPGKTQYSTMPPPAGLHISSVIHSVNPLNWLKWGLRIRKMAPDLVVMKFWLPFMAPCLGTIARLARSNRKTKVIAALDNLIPHEKRMLDHSLTQYFAHSVDGFVAMSREVLQQVGIFTKTKPRTFSPHPVYDHYGDRMDKGAARQRLGIDPQGNYLLFFGFIRDYKGLDLLLKAMADERIRSGMIRLIVAGEYYTAEEPYRKLIDQYDLHGQVIMHTHFIPDSQVAQYFCAADVVVQPYKTATQSGVTQIAYHFGVPMIITNVGGLAEFVPDGKVGYVVEPEPEQIADAIVRFFDERHLVDFRTHIADEARKYQWEHFISSILGLLGTDKVSGELSTERNI